MASITDLRNIGTDLLTAANPLPEPISAPTRLRSKLDRFDPDIYNVNQDSHLYRFLIALCGDAGAGALKKELLYPRLQGILESTHFTDLDRLYGDPLGLPRITSEIYTTDPLNQSLTQTQWEEIYQKDASYRARSLLWMRAIIAGPTHRGIALAAEAAIGVECTIIERYLYLENAGADQSITVPNVGQTSSYNEITIIPQKPSVSADEARRILHLVDRLRPVNTHVTISTGALPRAIVTPRSALASTEYFVIKRLVVGSTSVNWPTLDPNNGYWIESGVEHEATTFAFLNRQDSITFLNITGITASTTHVGNFNIPQQQLFQHLASSDQAITFSAEFAIAPAATPISLATPWIFSHNG